VYVYVCGYKHTHTYTHTHTHTHTLLTYIYNGLLVAEDAAASISRSLLQYS
jgi:hypothetical protein